MQKLIQDHLLFPEVLWERPLNIYKRALGKVLVIAGSRGMAGAAALTLEAAYRAGAGIVTLGFPEGLVAVYKKILPEAMTLPLPETPAGSISTKAKDEIIKNSQDFDCAVIGPGLSQNAETMQLVWEIFFKIKKPIILDADGLNAISLGFQVIKRVNPVRSRPAVGTATPIPSFGATGQAAALGRPVSNGVKKANDIVEFLKERMGAPGFMPVGGVPLVRVKRRRQRNPPG